MLCAAAKQNAKRQSYKYKLYMFYIQIIFIVYKLDINYTYIVYKLFIIYIYYKCASYVYIYILSVYIYIFNIWFNVYIYITVYIKLLQMRRRLPLSTAHQSGSTSCDSACCTDVEIKKI